MKKKNGKNKENYEKKKKMNFNLTNHFSYFK